MHTHKVTLSNDRLWLLRQSINDFLNACPNLKGIVINTIHLNLKVLNDPLVAFENAQASINDKFVQKDESGSLKLEELPEEDLLNGKKPGYLYIDEDAKKSAEDEWQEMLKFETTVELHRFEMKLFNELDINIHRCQNVGLIIDYCVMDNSE